MDAAKYYLNNEHDLTRNKKNQEYNNIAIKQLDDITNHTLAYNEGRALSWYIAHLIKTLRIPH
jgi:hypothetical protein